MRFSICCLLSRHYLVCREPQSACLSAYKYFVHLSMCVYVRVSLSPSLFLRFHFQLPRDTRLGIIKNMLPADIVLASAVGADTPLVFNLERWGSKYDLTFVKEIKYYQLRLPLLPVCFCSGCQICI